MNQQLASLNFVGILEQAPLRRPGGAGAILVIGATMTRTHEQIRLREPADGTSQVRAINGKHLKFLPINIAYPAGDVRRFSVPGIHHWVAIGGQTGLASRKLIQPAKRQPGVISWLAL